MALLFGRTCKRHHSLFRPSSHASMDGMGFANTPSSDSTHPTPTHIRQQAFATMADGGEGGGGGGQRLLDVSNLSPKELKEWRRFNVVLEGQATAENTKKRLVPFQQLHDFVVYKGRSGTTMSWPQSKPSTLPYTGSLRIEGQLRRTAIMVSGRQMEKTLRVVAHVRRFTVDVRIGEQRGIWIEANEVWFLLREPTPDFAALDSFRNYQNRYNKVRFAFFLRVVCPFIV